MPITHWTRVFVYAETSESEAKSIFSKVLDSKKLSDYEHTALKSYMLVLLGRWYAANDWTLQLHVGAQRFTSSRLRSLVGGAGGFAAIGNTTDIRSIVAFLDVMERQQALPKIILYNLNPVDNQAFASLTGSFVEDHIAGKVQFGPAWWYNDHLPGIINQLVVLANYGVLHHFIGMTTDSRSFLSLSRHEYFRRIFCNLIGEWVEAGQLPYDESLLNEMTRAVCYGNAKKYIQNKNKQNTDGIDKAK